MTSTTIRGPRTHRRNAAKPAASTSAARADVRRKRAGSGRPLFDRQDIRLYIAREAARHYGPIEPGLAERTRRNVRRNFGTLLALDRVAALLDRYKAIYGTAAQLLPEHLVAVVRGTYADPSHVRWTPFLAALARRYRGESREILGLVANYAIYYEYLR